MKTRIFVLFMILATLCTGIASATTIHTDGESTAAQVTVTGVKVNPAVLMRGDTGLVTVEITNTGTQPVPFDRVELSTNDLSVKNYQMFSTGGMIGAGNSIEFTFSVEGNAPDGIYYLQFYVDYRDAGYLTYYIPIQIDTSGLEIAVVDCPDAFPAGKSEDLVISIANPHGNEFNGIIITPKGAGLESTPTSMHIGTLGPDESSEAVFTITPEIATDLTFNVIYRNGVNNHIATLTIPIEIGEGKISPDLVVNNLEITGSGASYTVTGDVTNAGLEMAYSIKVTTNSPAKGIYPYPVDVIGALEPDDFSSFEVTFNAMGATAIPLVIEYKDEDGNTFEDAVSVSLNTARQVVADAGDSDVQKTPSNDRRGPMGSFGGGLGTIPYLEIILIIVSGVVVVIAWRKGLFGTLWEKVKERFHK